MEMEAARAKGMSPSQALADSINNAFKSGAVVVFVQGVPGLNEGPEEASAEVQTMLRNGSTTVYITGGVKPALLKVDDSDDPVPLFGRGILQLSKVPEGLEEGTLPFALTASGILEDGTLPSPLTEEKLQDLSLPVDLQTGKALPYSMQSSDGRMFFSLVKSDCSARVIVNMTATGTIVPSEGCKWPAASNEASYDTVGQDPMQLRSGATVVFLETALPSEGDALAVEDPAIKLRSGSNTVLRSGSTTVYLTGGVQPSTVQADGTLPLPLNGIGMIDIRMPEGGDMLGNGNVVSEGTLPFALRGEGTLKMPKEILADGTLPIPKAKALSSLVIDLGVQSGLTLPRGIKGTGKLTIPEPEDGTNPWPSIPKDMLPWVLTGSGTIKLEDGTWPLPRLEMEDRIIRIRKIDAPTNRAEPVHPDDSAPIVAPEGTKATPDPVNPGDLPLDDSTLLDGPTKAGPDPAPAEDRTGKSCCCGH